MFTLVKREYVFDTLDGRKIMKIRSIHKFMTRTNDNFFRP